MHIQGIPKNSQEKFDISGTVADIFTNFTEYTDRYSPHILQILLKLKFY